MNWVISPRSPASSPTTNIWPKPIAGARPPDSRPPDSLSRHSFWQKYLDDWKTCRNFAAEYSRKYVFIMATVVLQVPDESLVSKVKNACKMLVGVASVKVLSKREKSDACIESSEREATRRNVKVLKATKEKDYDITKTAGYREAMDDVKNGRVTTYDSVDDMFKKLGINV